MTLTVGTCLGLYEILCALDVGGMGEVYWARDTRLDRTVATKVLPAHLSGDPPSASVSTARRRRSRGQANHGAEQGGMTQPAQDPAMDFRSGVGGERLDDRRGSNNCGVQVRERTVR